jgi:phage terminase small subunit
MRPLNPRQTRFIREYLISRNGEQAAITAGYPAKTARSKAAHLLTNVNIRTEIKRQKDAIAAASLITVHRLLQEIAHLAFSNVSDFCDENGNPRPLSDVPLNARKAIQSIKWGAEGVVEYKLWDKGAAQERLAKHLGLFMEQSDLQGMRDKLADLIARALASQRAEDAKAIRDSAETRIPEVPE